MPYVWIAYYRCVYCSYEYQTMNNIEKLTRLCFCCGTFNKPDKEKRNKIKYKCHFNLYCF